MDKKDGVNGIVRHEMAHVLEFVLTCREYGIDPFSSNNYNIVSKFLAAKDYGEGVVSGRIVDEAIQNLGLDDNAWETLSVYAAIDKSEAFAEAMSDASDNKLSAEIRRIARGGI